MVLENPELILGVLENLELILGVLENPELILGVLENNEELSRHEDKAPLTGVTEWLNTEVKEAAVESLMLQK